MGKNLHYLSCERIRNPRHPNYFGLNKSRASTASHVARPPPHIGIIAMILSKNNRPATIARYFATWLILPLMTGWFGHAWVGSYPDHSDVKRNVADFSLASLNRLGAKIAAGQDLRQRCGARSFGSGWGHHFLCSHRAQARKCFFYSFGISRDYSFDIDLANSTACYGFASDPTVTHSSKLHPRVFFTQMAAMSFDPVDTAQFVLRTTIPALRMLLGHDHVTVLKMDCEGCEYSLARDVLEQDPDFFKHVDQFAVEVHYSKRWMKTKNHLHALAALIELLENAGMDLVHFEAGGCSPEAQATGIIPEVETLELIKSVRRPDGRDLHCHNYLFARV
jgi:hypothetical protein